MDFGIDRLIEMIEQRISRPVANAVLYVLTFAVLAWGIRTVGAVAIAAFTYIRALLLYFHGAKAPHLTPSDVLGLLWETVFLTLLLMVFFAGMLVIRRRINKGLKATFIELENIVEDCKAFADKTRADLHADTEKFRVEALQMVEMASTTADKIVVDLEAQIKSGTPSPQSPPSTEADKQP